MLRGLAACKEGTDLNGQFVNPILPGFYPDPSVCRVGEDYWLVTSTFSYFPGVPVFHSRDLVNWEQVGHVLDRPSQLNLDGVAHSHGIFAPTIRHHAGVFYMITTLVGKQGNFIVTASHPAGPWSEPFWLDDAPGIDPSLFFDEDGTAWVTGTADAPDAAYWGDNEIWMRQLDLETMKLTGPRHGLWRGALKQAMWPEAPHLYRIGDWYYLMIAEGGTEFYHSVTIARSKSLTGPYEGNPANPILTHRHLGKDAPIWNPGHADLVRTPAGEWWMVCLASRPYGGHFRNMGRETFLAPVVWEDGWPVVSPGTGRLEFQYATPVHATAETPAGDGSFSGSPSDASADVSAGNCATAGAEGTTRQAVSAGGAAATPCAGCNGRTGGCCGTTGRPSVPGAVGMQGQPPTSPAYVCEHDDFDTETLSPVWNFLRTPRQLWWSLSARPGFLRMRLRPAFLGEAVNPCFLGRRQQHMTFTITTELRFSPDRDGQSAGLVLLQSDAWHVRLALVRMDGALMLQLVQVRNGVETELAHADLLDATEVAAGMPPLVLRVEAEMQSLRFLCGRDEAHLMVLADEVDARMLSTDMAGGFVGTYVGMFAQGENPDDLALADFDSFTYEGC